MVEENSMLHILMSFEFYEVKLIRFTELTLSRFAVQILIKSSFSQLDLYRIL